LGDEVGIKPGDLLLRVNGFPVRDVIDYRFHMAADYVEITLLSRDEKRTVSAQKPFDDLFGLEFREALFDGVRECVNDCRFCFLRQLPPGLRPSLYLRDDDYRLSFLWGNFITLTNLTEGDMKRIKSQRLSPLYISVHATDPEIRSYLLGNSKAKEIVDQMKTLIEAGITLHCQIVLLPGINDKKVLVRSIADLAGLWPGVRSVGVVPIGLTKYAPGSLRGLTVDDAREAVDICLRFKERMDRSVGYPFVFPSDELMLLAQKPFPPLEAYADLPQMENGIGMCSLFKRQVQQSKRYLPAAVRKPRSVLVVTARSAESLLREALWELDRVSGLRVGLMAVDNGLFGPSVTVSGLLSGQDLMGVLDRKAGNWDLMVIPGSMVNSEGVFLDGTSPRDVSQRLGMELVVARPTARDLYSAVVGPEDYPADVKRGRKRGLKNEGCVHSGEA